MSEKRQLPAFKSETEEAQWWFDNREARGEEFAQAIRDGSAGRNTLAARVAASLATVRLDDDDVETAWNLAAKRGLDYQQYVKQVLHEALQREVNESRFHPIPVSGEAVSATILRDRE
jgi:predicted DNA binding CopG/RHH family protein